MPETTLLLVDMLNPYDHPDSRPLAQHVGEIIEPLTDLMGRARDSDDVELVYVNDNYGDFAASRDDLVRRALEGERPDLVKPIVPSEDCMFLTKVRHSAFYSTALGYLLGRLGTRRLIIAGQVTEQCILYTALDAYVRHFEIEVPTDAVAHIDPELGAAALKMMETNMRADIVSAAACLR